MFLQSLANPECNSDEADSRTGGAASNPSPEPPSPATSHSRRKHSAGTSPAPADTIRRPRGRPPGSKNKPKPPIAAAGASPAAPSSPAAMQPYVLEIAAGEDIVGTLARFSKNRNLGLAVVSAAGVVSGVVLHSAANLSLAGAFEILSISATFFPPSFTAAQPGAAAVTLAGPNGQIFGGLVAPPLRAAAAVTVIAVVFRNPSYHRLPAEDEISSPPSSPAAKVRRGGQAAAEACGLSMFGPALPEDAMWAAPPRSPPY